MIKSWCALGNPGTPTFSLELLKSTETLCLPLTREVSKPQVLTEGEKALVLAYVIFTRQNVYRFSGNI